MHSSQKGVIHAILLLPIQNFLFMCVKIVINNKQKIISNNYAHIFVVSSIPMTNEKFPQLLGSNKSSMKQ